jgi:alanyl-tRNA synthetase
VLDRTAFYPEGGGQPGDTGVLYSEEGELRVVKAMKRGAQIFHYLDGGLKVGSEVRGVIDWDERFWNMRRHSGEHLLTGLLESRGSGPKVFSSLTQLDFKPSSLDETILNEVTEVFNGIIEADIPVRIYSVNREKLDVGDDERKKSFLEKIPGNTQTLRMVEMGDHAVTFCMGTHVKTTGDIGMIKTMSLEHKKKRRKIVYFELEE